jgi:Ser/Thr protein kinase RdoA (MazF antagonist)
MSLLQHAPRFDVADVARLAREVYGFDASPSPLPSERDQNFLLVTAAGERFVLKIANAAEDPAILDAQNAALARLAAAGVDVCPRIVPSRGGEAMVRARSPRGDGSASHLVRLLTCLPGVALAEVTERPPALLESLGSALGGIDRALSDFDHPAIHREFHWDLASAAGVIREHLPRIAEASSRATVDAVSARALRELEPRVPRLRRSAIHNDANDWNVLVGGGVVTGIVDFGDLAHSWTVAEPAVAIAYAVLDASDPLATAAAVARGYHAQHPLSGDEWAVLFPLVCLRLCQSACIAAWQVPQRPGDKYLDVSQAAIRRTLPGLAAIEYDRAERALREA